jgi:hypothetical protein
MSADVHDLTGDKTMNTNSCVRLADDDVWSVRPTGGTSTVITDSGTSESAYRRPHAPRSGKPKNAALTSLHFDISSTSERSGATHRLRVSECAPSSLRPLDRIRASYRRRIGDSPTDHVSQIHSPIWSRGRTAHSNHWLPGLSVDSYGRYQLVACCGPKSTQLRPKSRVDSAQTKSIPGPLPLAVHRVAFTTLQLATTTTHVSKQLTVSANDSSAHQINRK